MSQVYYYGWSGTAYNLGSQSIRLGQSASGYSMQAETGAIGNSSMVFDDPTATLGQNNDGLHGLGNFFVYELDCAAVGADGVNGKRLYSGYLKDRTYERGNTERSSLITGAARQITANLEDLNAVASFKLLHGSNVSRPAETDVTRVNWLLTDSNHWLWSATNDAGWVDTSGPVNMDAVDYGGQTAAQVLHDCAIASGKNWWIGFWEATGNASLWYADSNTSTAYASLLRLTSDLAEVDNTTTFAVVSASLNRKPDRVYEGVLVQGNGVSSYKTGSAYALGFAWRDGSAPNANVKTQAAADALATRLVNDASVEEDRLTVIVQLPSSLATGIKAGQRIQVKFPYLTFGDSQMDYSAWVWCRVMNLQVQQDEPTDKRYTLKMELTPQAASTNVLYDATVTGTEAWFPAADHGVALNLATRYNWTVVITRTSGTEFGYGTRWEMVTGPSTVSGTIAGGANVTDSWIESTSLPDLVGTASGGSVTWATASDSAAPSTIYGIPVTVSGYFITPSSPVWTNGWVAYFMYYNVNQSHGGTTWSAHITLTLG